MDSIFLIIAVLVGIVLIFLAYLLIQKKGERKSNFLIGFLALLGVVLIAFPVYSTIQIQYGDLTVKFKRLEEKLDSTNTEIAQAKDSTKAKITRLERNL